MIYFYYLKLLVVPNIKDSSENMIKSDEDNLNAESNDFLKNAEANQLIKETIDGFLVILSTEGDITYVSDNITEYLGIAKVSTIA